MVQLPQIWLTPRLFHHRYNFHHNPTLSSSQCPYANLWKYANIASCVKVKQIYYKDEFRFFSNKVIGFSNKKDNHSIRLEPFIEPFCFSCVKTICNPSNLSCVLKTIFFKPMIKSFMDYTIPLSSFNFHSCNPYYINIF